MDIAKKTKFLIIFNCAGYDGTIAYYEEIKKKPGEWSFVGKYYNGKYYTIEKYNGKAI